VVIASNDAPTLAACDRLVTIDPDMDASDVTGEGDASTGI
jgi:hypothetical protein